MKLLILFAVSALFATRPVLGGWSEHELVARSANSSLPSCADGCMAAALQNSTCQPTDKTCPCTNEVVEAAFTGCAAANCRVIDFLQVLNQSATACDRPVRDKHQQFVTMANVFVAISTTFIALRFIQRYLHNSPLFADDYLILLSFALTISTSVINIHGIAANGLGRDIWTLTPAEIYALKHFTYFDQTLYFTEIFVVKLSILAFYLRIFPGTRIQKLIKGTLVIIILIIILFAFLSIFECTPISYYWLEWDGEHEGKCLDLDIVFWPHGLLSILSDIWVIALPISQLKNLNLHWKKKVGVSFMFLVGLFVTIISILRLQFLLSFANSTNESWDQYNTILWSVVEAKVSLWCACMPSVRLLLVWLAPKVMSTRLDRSRIEKQSKGSSSHNSNNKRNQLDPEQGNDMHTMNDLDSGIMYSRTFEVNYDASRSGADIENGTHDIDLESTKSKHTVNSTVALFRDS